MWCVWGGGVTRVSQAGRDHGMNVPPFQNLHSVHMNSTGLGLGTSRTCPIVREVADVRQRNVSDFAGAMGRLNHRPPGVHPGRGAAPRHAQEHRVAEACAAEVCTAMGQTMVVMVCSRRCEHATWN